MSHSNGSPPIRRIAMLSVHTCPLAMLGGKKTGGMNVYVRDFSREMGRQGVAVDVFTRSQDDCVPRVVHDLGYGGRVIHIPAGPERPIPVADIIDYLDDFSAGVLRFAAEERLQYDIIHSHYWLSGLVAEMLRKTWLAADGRYVPVVQMFHTLGHMKNRVATSDTERAPQVRLDGELQVIQNVDRIVAATPAEQAQLNWLYNADMDKVAIIPPGVDLQRFAPIPKIEAKEQIGIPFPDKNIVFAGRIEPLKGIDSLLLAMAMIRQRHSDVMQNVCVAIIGGDPWSDDPDAEMARLIELRATLDIHDIVTFVGAKDQHILPAYYAAAEMVVMPSHYESFGMVALEAMAMGTPVVASEVGGLAFLVQDGVNGLHAPSQDPEALAECIYELLTDEPYRARLGQQAQVYAQDYGWQHIVVRMLRVYATVMADKVCVERP